MWPAINMSQFPYEFWFFFGADIITEQWIKWVSHVQKITKLLNSILLDGLQFLWLDDDNRTVSDLTLKRCRRSFLWMKKLFNSWQREQIKKNINSPVSLWLNVEFNVPWDTASNVMTSPLPKTVNYYTFTCSTWSRVRGSDSYYCIFPILRQIWQLLTSDRTCWRFTHLQ